MNHHTKKAIEDFRARMLAAVEALVQDLTPQATAAAGRKNHPAQVFSTRVESKGELVCESISVHAIERWRERTKSQQSDTKVINTFAKMLATAERWRLKQIFEAREILNHGTPSKYWKQGPFIFVVENGCVVTVHQGSAKRWEPVLKQSA